MLSANGKLIYKIWLIVAICTLVIIATGTVIMLIRERKNKSPFKKTMYIVPAVSILVFGLSWVFNYGMIRMTLSFVALPFLYSLVLFLYNILVAEYAEKSKKIVILNIAFYVTFILANLFMPDKGNIGPGYLFFGLIKGYKISRVATLVSWIMIAVHAVLFVWQIIEVSLIKKALKTDKLHEIEKGGNNDEQ